MNVFKMIVILPLLRRNTDLGLNGHPITYWLIKICFRLRILIRFKRYLEIVQSVKSYFAKLNRTLKIQAIQTQLLATRELPGVALVNCAISHIFTII